MKRSDQLIKAALDAKAGETEAASAALESMASTLKARIANLQSLKAEQLRWLDQNKEAAFNELQRETQVINSNHERDVANVNMLFDQMIAGEEEHLAAISDFDRRMVKGFDDGGSNSKAKPKLVAAGS